jgi:hypothetical protein
MEVTAILCNHAESVNNLLFVSAGGIEQALIQPGQPAPWAVSIGIGMSIEVPWTATNQEHSVNVTLVDSDGQPFDMATGPDTRQEFAVDLKFNVGRPPQLSLGASQTVQLAINIPVLPFEKLGQYDFVIAVDGSEEKRLHYRVASLPGVTVGSQQ